MASKGEICLKSCLKEKIVKKPVVPFEDRLVDNISSLQNTFSHKMVRKPNTVSTKTIVVNPDSGIQEDSNSDCVDEKTEEHSVTRLPLLKLTSLQKSKKIPMQTKYYENCTAKGHIRSSSLKKKV